MPRVTRSAWLQSPCSLYLVTVSQSPGEEGKDTYYLHFIHFSISIYYIIFRTHEKDLKVTYLEIWWNKLTLGFSFSPSKAKQRQWDKDIFLLRKAEKKCTCSKGHSKGSFSDKRKGTTDVRSVIQEGKMVPKWQIVVNLNLQFYGTIIIYGWLKRNN